jgi:hypothetical protein
MIFKISISTFFRFLADWSYKSGGSGRAGHSSGGSIPRPSSDHQRGFQLPRTEDKRNKRKIHRDQPRLVIFMSCWCEVLFRSSPVMFLSWSRFCHGHVFVMVMFLSWSCLCQVLACLCHGHVLVMIMFLSSHTQFMSWSRLSHDHVSVKSWLCHVMVMSCHGYVMSWLCHVMVMLWSWLCYGHVFVKVMFMSSNVMFMSSNVMFMSWSCLCHGHVFVKVMFMSSPGMFVSWSFFSHDHVSVKSYSCLCHGLV